MSHETNITYHCDRCKKEIIPDTGTLNQGDEALLKEKIHLSIKNYVTEKTRHSSYSVDLCNDCLSSLENWYFSEEYKEVESKWNIVKDLPKMNRIINSMAFEINTHRIEAAKNRNHIYIKHPNDIVQQYKDIAEEKRN